MLRWIQNTGQIFQSLKRCLENDRPKKIIETGHREGDYEMLTDEHGKNITQEQVIYVNRELSWLKFNERVLEEAKNEKVPLCERMTFLSIYQTNLDEFFMVRVGSLEDMKLLDEETRENKTNMTPQEQIDAILKRVKVLNDEKDVVYDHVMKLVEDVGVRLVSFRDMDKAESKSLEAYFIKEVLPLLSVMIVAISIFKRTGDLRPGDPGYQGWKGKDRYHSVYQ